jgi:DNA-binding transcriptional LysR family regulator
LVLVSPGAAPRGRVRWSQLRDARLLGLPPDNAVQQLVGAQLRAAGITDGPALQFNNLHTLLAMVEAGFGSAVLPSFVSDACARYAVRIASLTHPRKTMEFYAIWAKGTAAAEPIRVFAQCLAQHFASGPQRAG